MAKTAVILVMMDNWETDLNSEKSKGSKHKITTMVVLITACPVVYLTYRKTSSLFEFVFLW